MPRYPGRSRPKKGPTHWRETWLKSFLEAEFAPVESACQAVQMTADDLLDEIANSKFRNWIGEKAEEYGHFAIHALYLRLCHGLLTKDIDLTAISGPVATLMRFLAERFDPKAIPTRQVMHLHQDRDFEDMTTQEIAEWLVEHAPAHLKAGGRKMTGQIIDQRMPLPKKGANGGTG